MLCEHFIDSKREFQTHSIVQFGKIDIKIKYVDMQFLSLLPSYYYISLYISGKLSYQIHVFI